MKKIAQTSSRFQLPDWFVGADGESHATSYRVRWFARRCRVSLATAATLVVNAGFAAGDRH